MDFRAGKDLRNYFIPFFKGDRKDKLSMMISQFSSENLSKKKYLINYRTFRCALRKSGKYKLLFKFGLFPLRNFPFIYYKIPFFKKNYYLFDKERERTQGERPEGEGEREGEKQTFHCTV